MSDSVIPVVPVCRDIQVLAEKVVEIIPAYMIRKTASKTFRCLTLVEDEKANWKKGLVYFISRYSKGINLELWLYSTKGGAHLSEYNGKFRALAIDGIVCDPLGHAVKLRIQILDTDTDEQVEAKIKAFTSAIEPTVTEVRALVPVPVVSKKESKKVEVPVVVEAVEEVTAPPAQENPPTEAPKAKSKAKIKKA